MASSPVHRDNPFTDVAARGFANLGEHLPDLQHRYDEVAGGLERSTRHAFEVRDRLAEVEGHGEAESGLVKVTVDGGGRLKDIEFAPTIMKVGSVGRLREAVLDAAADAVDDAMGKVRELSGADSDGIPDPLGEFLGRMPEVTRLLPPRSAGSVAGPAQQRSGRTGRTPCWQPHLGRSQPL